jgi:hypothetical protein
MRSSDDIDRVFAGHRAGLPATELARTTGVSLTQVRRWLRTGEVDVRSSPMRRGLHDGDRCALADGVDGPAYAYLLGQYLGDGSIVRVGRSERLEICTTTTWPGIRAEVLAAIATVIGRSGGTRATNRGATVVTSYSSHWPCLLPQHGPGRKHLRPIVLQPWQQAIALDQHPGLLLRGLVHSDGWRGTNPVRRGERRYEYSRYSFDNRSDDIRGIFCEACDRLGISWRRGGRWTIYVSRREAVARLDEFVGPKS